MQRYFLDNCQICQYCLPPKFCALHHFTARTLMKRFYVYTVPLNYNFISTRVDTRGNTWYFVCKMPNFPVENIISMWRDVAFPRDDTWLFHVTRHGIYTRRDQPNGIWDNYYYATRECSYLQLKPVSKCPAYIPFCHAYYAFLLKFFQL